jgi:hypothetical protein
MVGSDPEFSFGPIRLVVFDSPGIEVLRACPIARATGRKSANNRVLDVELVRAETSSMSVREVPFGNLNSTVTP